MINESFNRSVTNIGLYIYIYIYIYISITDEMLSVDTISSLGDELLTLVLPIH